MSSDGINQAALDRFTSAHGGVGITMAALGVPWWVMLGLTVGWEVVENYLKEQKPHLFPYSSEDSADNSVADTAAVIVGFMATRQLMRQGLSEAGKASLHAAIGSTAGAFFGSGAFGFLGKVVRGEGDGGARGSSEATTWGRGGYMVGTAVGGAVGGGHGAPVSFEEAGAFGGAVGGAAFGPLGAAIGTYLSIGIAEQRR